MMKLTFAIFALFLIASCSNSNKADFEVKAELQMMDTLETRLDEVKSWLDKMPLSEIKERKDIVNHNLDFIESYHKESGEKVDIETAQLFDEYKGYGKLYGRTIDAYKHIVMETEELYVQLKTLKESAHSKDYKKELFLNYFQKEKADVEQLYNYSKSYLYRIIETDLMFERSQKRIEEVAEKLKK